MSFEPPPLHTTRLILCPLDLSHLEVMVSLGRDPEVMRYLGVVRPEAELRAHYRAWIAAPACRPGLGRWAVVEKSRPQEVLGFVVYDILPDTDFIEIGYRYARAAWGRGTATEAAARALDQGFQASDLSVIAAVTDPDNRASQKILRKIGLTRRADRFAYGEVLPFFTITRTEWDGRAG